MPTSYNTLAFPKQSSERGGHAYQLIAEQGWHLYFHPATTPHLLAAALAASAAMKPQHLLLHLRTRRREQRVEIELLTDSKGRRFAPTALK